MHNSDQVRDFFRKMADGLVLNPTVSGQTAPVSVQDNRGSQEKQTTERVKKFADFGVGLPPLAHG